MSFFSSLFGGSNPTLNAGMKQAGDVSQFTTGLGKNLTGQAGNYFSTLLSGDPRATAKLLSPQIGTLQKQGQQEKKTMAEFGTRSGGLASKGQTVDDTTRASISDLVSKLTTGAAGTAATMGSNLIDTGLAALNQQTQMSQQQMSNWENSLFGRGITTAASAAETYGLGG
jgi:hypothetical protein